MGKQRRQRRKPHKENPTGLVSIRDFEEELATESMATEQDRGESALHNVTEQLKSPNLEERLSALQNLESMCYEKELALEILKRGLTKIIAPFLVDSHTQIRSASASTLRRIGENGGNKAYQSLLHDDVMTPLTALLKNYYADWRPGSESTNKRESEDEKETVIQAITLLWSLCENSERVIKSLNQEKLVSLLIKFLDWTTYGTTVSVVSAQCLLTLSEDNPIALRELKQNENMLLHLLDAKSKSEREKSEIVPLTTLVAGLLINLNDEFTTKSDNTTIICKVVAVIGNTLAIDHKNIIIELASLLPSERTNLSKSAKLKLQASKKILGAQQQALEILANLCSEEHDSESDTDLDDSDPAEYENECMDDDPMIEKSSKIQSSSLPVSLIEVINSTGLINNIKDKILAPDKSINNELLAHPDTRCIIKLIHTLRCRAFLCLNNLIASLDTDTFGGTDQLYRLWLDIGNIVFKDCDANDIELLESATSAMRAAVQKLAEMQANTFLQQISIVDIEPMLSGERQCANPNIRANLVRILGNLALIMSPLSQYSPLVKHISISLLEICTKESEVWVLAEALDSLMDIFAEDETDFMANEIKLVPKLNTLVPVLTNKIRQQRKHLGDHSSIVSTVKTNLTRFIKYKGSQVARIK